MAQKTKNNIVGKSSLGTHYTQAKNIRQFYNKNTRAQRSDAGKRRKP